LFQDTKQGLASFIKASDIYNAHQHLRAVPLAGRLPIQAHLEKFKTVAFK
jgi:hypothetical protein